MSCSIPSDSARSKPLGTASTTTSTRPAALGGLFTGLREASNLTGKDAAAALAGFNRVLRALGLILPEEHSAERRNPRSHPRPRRNPLAGPPRQKLGGVRHPPRPTRRTRLADEGRQGKLHLGTRTLSSDSNPYAPPGVAETEAPSSRYWYSDGTSLIVRNGATLPKVDLDTGISEGPMEPFQRIVNVSNPLDFLMGALVVGGFLALRSYANLESVGLLIPLLSARCAAQTPGFPAWQSELRHSHVQLHSAAPRQKGHPAPPLPHRNHDPDRRVDLRHAVSIRKSGGFRDDLVPMGAARRSPGHHWPRDLGHLRPPADQDPFGIARLDADHGNPSGCAEFPARRGASHPVARSQPPSRPQASRPHGVLSPLSTAPAHRKSLPQSARRPARGVDEVFPFQPAGPRNLSFLGGGGGSAPGPLRTTPPGGRIMAGLPSRTGPSSRPNV